VRGRAIGRNGAWREREAGLPGALNSPLLVTPPEPKKEGDHILFRPSPVFCHHLANEASSVFACHPTRVVLLVLGMIETNLS
jgi:hypothetical protein